ncbi:MAG: hypothetical protein ACXAB2_05530 [Candidatus Hodarchaeales archaeon]|jgi:hypothetical protein
MGSWKESELGVQFGNYYWKLLKIIVNQRTNDVYFIFPIPDVGLKYSYHPPKPPEHQTLHFHLQCNILGIHDDLDSSFLSPSFLNDFTKNVYKSFRFRKTVSDDEVILFQSNNLRNLVAEESTKKGKKTVFNFESMLNLLGHGVFYSTTEKRLPQLLQDLQPRFDQHNLNTLAVKQGSAIIPLSNSWMFEFQFQHVMDTLNRTSLKPIFDPLGNAVNQIQQSYPTLLQRWFPAEQIATHMYTTLMKQNFDPEIIQF